MLIRETKMAKLESITEHDETNTITSPSEGETSEHVNNKPEHKEQNDTNSEASGEASEPVTVSGDNGEVDSNNNNGNNKHTSTPGQESDNSRVKYQLRPRSLHPRRRCDSEWSFQDSFRHKQRPQPLSRYRRKTANARERCRMRQINTAFESLRGVLPSWVCSRRAAADMTKITTLRLASAYIRSLQDILDGNAAQDTCSWILSSILGEAAPLSDLPKNQQAVYTQPQSDLMTLLCATQEQQLLHGDIEDSLDYLSPMSETEAVALLLGTDTQPRPSWGEIHHAPLVSS